MGSLATRRVSFWRTALKLGRVSNLPTVWSNVIAATTIAGGAPLELVALLAAATSLMYVAGMFLNDGFDRDIDARERPERPIPSGDVSPETVLIVGAALLAGGTLTLAAVNDHAGLAGAALAGAILFYNWNHKGNPFAPWVMGLCRALVYVAAATAVSLVVPAGIGIPAAATLLYVAALTYAARMEAADSIASFRPLPLLLAPLAASVLLSEAVSAPAAVAVALLAATGARVAWLLRRRGPGDVSGAVALLIAGISLNDALLTSSTGVDHAVFACLACFGLTLLLQRYVPAT